MHTKFWEENLKVRSHLEGKDIDKSIILKWMLQQQEEKLWTVLMWLNIWTSDWML
jgi:hypothetical protein